jgi:hypothetical protein
VLLVLVSFLPAVEKSDFPANYIENKKVKIRAACAAISVALLLAKQAKKGLSIV